MDKLWEEEHTESAWQKFINNEKIALISYFLGLGLFLLAFAAPFSPDLKKGLMVLVLILAGYYVIWEGIEETIADTKARGKFTPNIHVLMGLAAVGALIIDEFVDGPLLILIFAAANFLEDYAEGRSRREITALLKMHPTEARRLLANDTTEIVPVQKLKIGDRVLVQNGDQVPTDGKILTGSPFIDESAITGESMPVEKAQGDDVFASTMNGDSSFTMRVTKDSQDTVFAKIVQLVKQSQENLSPAASKIKKFEPYYVNAVLLFVPLTILLMPLLGFWSWNESIYRGIVLLTVASPCALAASAVPATLSGLSNLARHGTLFKGGAYLTQLQALKAVAFDKTGTLTSGQPSVVAYEFLGTKAEQEDLKNIVVAMEKQANHPLARAITQYFDTQENSRVLQVTNETGKGLWAQVDGEEYRIGKPSLFNQVPKQIASDAQTEAEAGATVVYVAKNKQVRGFIALMDRPLAASVQAIQYFKKEGVATIMITGDSDATGQAVGQTLGLDHVESNVLPEDKAHLIKSWQKKAGATAMVGDGVNDAPALVTADVGIAMGQGTDIAIDTADVVLTQNDLTRLTYAHRVSKKLNRVVLQNITFALGVIILLIILNFLGKIDIAWGVVAHEGSTILVIFNGLRLLLPLREE